MVCAGCGAEANASCNCGVSYVAKSVRAAEAIRANPGKSDRAIAAELGVGRATVQRAREVAHDEPPEERIGRDGKSYSIRQRVVDDPAAIPNDKTAGTSITVLHVGVIAIRTGSPHDEDPWEWHCGFYPGSRPGEHPSGHGSELRRGPAEVIPAKRGTEVPCARVI
jgi:hypothetical protein